MNDQCDSILGELLKDFNQQLKNELNSTTLKNSFDIVGLFIKDYVKIYMYSLYSLIISMFLINIIILLLTIRLNFFKN